MPAGASLSINLLAGNLGSIVLGGTGSTLSINNIQNYAYAPLTNNLGLSIPAGASLNIGSLSGNLGSVVLGGVGSNLTINNSAYLSAAQTITNNLGITVPVGPRRSSMA